MSYKTVKVIVCLLLGVISITGDKLVEYNEKNHLLRAIIDNLTHGCVAGLSWAFIVLLLNESIVKNIISILLCASMSSFIDVDHFIEAKSFHINDAIRLDHRPFFHCTTIPIVIWSTFLLGSKILSDNELNYYAWIVFTSFLSHHIRDGTRRGLWFFPFGSTRKIPYYLYIVMTMLLPFFVYFSMNKPSKKLIQTHGAINVA
ncbi:transmembrane protein 267 [Microplitis mediator]|uniref:transmembrane protein 267 n=1 Tax=Microplitis mediator TaxID=375433 RepID=UPI00255303D2|nr:transmembrane protein 267 [Microplitis mediator]